MPSPGRASLLLPPPRWPPMPRRLLRMPEPLQRPRAPSLSRARASSRGPSVSDIAGARSSAGRVRPTPDEEGFVRMTRARSQRPAIGPSTGIQVATFLGYANQGPQSSLSEGKIRRRQAYASLPRNARHLRYAMCTCSVISQTAHRACWNRKGMTLHSAWNSPPAFDFSQFPELRCSIPISICHGRSPASSEF